MLNDKSIQKVLLWTEHELMIFTCQQVLLGSRNLTRARIFAKNEGFLDRG